MLDVGCGPGIGLSYALSKVAPRTISHFRFNPVARSFGVQWLAKAGFGKLHAFTDLDKDGFVHGVDI